MRNLTAQVRNAWMNRCWRCLLNPYHLQPDDYWDRVDEWRREKELTDV